MCFVTPWLLANLADPGTFAVHRQGHGHPGQRRQADPGQVLRRGRAVDHQGAEGFREEPLRQDPPGQRRDHHPGRSDLRLPQQRGPLLLRDGQQSGESGETGRGGRFSRSLRAPTADQSVPLGLQLILISVLNCLYEAISLILRKNVEKRALLDNLDIVMLALDEICDNG